MIQSNSPFAVVTGVSGRIGYALAERCAAKGFDLLIVSGDGGAVTAAERLRDHGVSVDPVQVELDTADGADELCDIVRVLGRPIDALVISAGRMPAAAFLSQDFEPLAEALDTGVVGPLRLTHRIGRGMRDRGQGRILIAGAAPLNSVGGRAVVCGTNAFLAGFALSLREELAQSGVSVTCLMPQARRAMTNENLGRIQAALDAKLGFEAMMRGDLGLTPATATAIAQAAGCGVEAARPLDVATGPVS